MRVGWVIGKYYGNGRRVNWVIIIDLRIVRVVWDWKEDFIVVI